MDNKIDFVITWVDGDDPVWQKERSYYADLEHIEIDDNSCRFRDWDTLRYWFRGVEKFAPWVNNIFFVTYGHLPKWLNTNHPKLRIVKHSDFIPAEYLPTFSSNVFEFYFHKIEGLSDKFVYFNDDMFLIDEVYPDRFFRDGLPCDIGAFVDNNIKGMFGCSVFIAINLINQHFNKKESVMKNPSKWFNLAYSFNFLLHNFLYFRIRRSSFNGFYNHHLPQGYLKKTYDEVWANCEKDLIRTSRSKFRRYGDVAPWLLRYWQLASGQFTPYSCKEDKYYVIKDTNILEISTCIKHQKFKMICLNDTPIQMNFDENREKILEAFGVILPDKCNFEL